GGIAHDFNNMLVGVLGNASLALRKLPENTEARRLVEEIMVSAQNASRLTSQLLAYSGKGRFVVQPLNLTLQAQKMERLLRMSIAGNANLKFDLDHEVPPINGDPAQVQQVIVNLVKNASEALEGKEGIITLCTGVRSLSRHPSQSPIAHYQIEPGRYAYIRVTDTGCGMPPKISEKAFEPFFSTKFTGRGLGLAAVQGIVLSHCGAIQYDSKVGRGTTFEVFFPVADGVVSLPSRIAQRFERRPEEQDRDQEREHVRGHEKESKQSMKNLSGTVLIVDDEQVVRTVASHILDEFGLKILTAESGPKAVEIYKKSGPEIDVVLLDMTMPGMNGVETFKELKKINPKVRVILTSGYSADEVQLNFDQGELAGFLEKPFTAQALSEKIGEALET
ncbi:MAG: response regulator, partial [Verrucomicrobiae bacterium]|nr:response regulator [Verrucomicrobiae bacterium]